MVAGGTMLKLKAKRRNIVLKLIFQLHFGKWLANFFTIIHDHVDHTIISYIVISSYVHRIWSALESALTVYSRAGRT